ncbi:cytochrome P450 [Massarina eburnea CBS 473.64]|uniref:Cytochrome P450 n=1 Tax=Massarina eburnea CBS 473.64 TaxID=1395130 RepID=A0A6A6RK18_9PLEO|nr:cytochrome P450 [Massarina eburnea CBS 473.64]
MAFLFMTAITIFAGIITLYLINRFRSKEDGRPLPPGPKGIPFFGNVNDMPKPGTLECHHWASFKDLYGPISSLTVLKQTFVIINDPQIAFELLRDKSAIFSSRPVQIFSGYLVGWRHATAMSPYNEAWKIHRKNVTKVISTTVSVAAFDRIQEVESVHFLLNLLEKPNKLFDHIRTEAGSVILKTVYGYTTEARGNDPFVDLATKSMQQFADATVPGRWVVDILPFLRYLPAWFPGAGFQTTAQKMSVQLAQCVNQPYQFVKKQMREKKHKTSFLSQAIESIGSDAEMEFIHKWTALALYLGGADTTVSSMMTFFLAMTLYPDVQRNARDEIDRVVGIGRLPVTADREQLPYIEAIMKEVHRWHPVLPMGLPHSSTEEIFYRGYRIPKGSVLLPNNWWFTHDPAVYSSPMTFDPSRHITTPTHPAEPDPRNFIFGYGRRICPGRFVADNALFITIAQSLAVFDIKKNTVEPEAKWETGTISHPVPYEYIIEPRSEDHRNLIRRSEEIYPWEQSDAKELETVKW